MSNKGDLKALVSILAIAVLTGAWGALPATAQTADNKSLPAAGNITNIVVSFKLDNRLSGATYGGERWVAPSTFMGATAQDTIDARANGVDAKGISTKINPQWVPSDAEMVTVSPSQGDQVKIVVHGAGESRVAITAQAFTKELVVKAKNLGKFIQVEITQSQPAAQKPRGAAAESNPTSPLLKAKKKQVSYAIGMNLAKALREQSIEVDEDLMVQGFRDTVSGSEKLMTEEQAQVTLAEVQTDQKILKADFERRVLAERNKREGEVFLAENAKKKGVVHLPSGLQYKIIKGGEGKKPTANDVITCQYRAAFIDGTEFGSSYKSKASLTVPVRSVMKGWAEALQLMPVGSKWQLFVPSDLAYGERGAGSAGMRRGGPGQQLVGPNATLIFELELLSIQDGSSTGTSVSGVATPSKSNAVEAVRRMTPAETNQ
jgi:FKBP-type peptidyl-prolyl cis-trans isomerase